MKPSTTIKLDTYIDANDQLIVSFREPGLEPIRVRPDRGLEDLVAAHPGIESLTVEICDFFQRGTIYEVYGAVLEDDGRTVAVHWKPTGRGQQHTFAISSAAAASRIKLVIGALPRRKDASVPEPLAPRVPVGSGPFPPDDPPVSGN